MNPRVFPPKQPDYKIVQPLTQAFKSGQSPILCATDVAARGLDIKESGRAGWEAILVGEVKNHGPGPLKS